MMNSGSKLRFALTLALLVAIAACSGKSDVQPETNDDDALGELRAEIRSAISDPDREERAIAVVDEFSLELVSLKQTILERQARFKELYANYDTTRAEFDAFAKESNDRLYRNQQRLVEQRATFLANTNSEEWAQILDARLKVIDKSFEPAQLN